MITLWPQKQTSRTIGHNIEGIAKQFLLDKKLHFIAQNFYCQHGEIDLIFNDQDTLVFIEVRYRKYAYFGSPIETINHSKQQKLIKTGKYYLCKNKLTESVNARFDVIGIVPQEQFGNIPSVTTETFSTTKQVYNIHWIQNAFEART